ncbi:ATP-binding protein [Kribbella sp. NPDC004536]|uniref:HD domain-containing protein n=1 Tax=Kribbella sp. NPDC004536 TaxID=3364106 RepID=UPI0036BA34E5
MNRTLSFAEEQAAKAGTLEAFSGFSLDHFRNQASEALGQIGRFGLFDEYTKHDISHVDGVLKRYNWLVPPDTREKMSVSDWLMVVLSTYLHDFGLLVTRAEYDARDKTKFGEFQASFEGRESYTAILESPWFRDLESDAKERFFYQEFVRQNHAARIRSWLTANPDPSIGLDPAVTALLTDMVRNLHPTFVADLGLVCQSHHLDDIYDTDKYVVNKPYGSSDEETANLQYCAILLRAADLLHITSDRAPAVAYSIINPTNPTSQVEWSKQNAVRSVRMRPAYNDDGEVDDSIAPTEIEVHATFADSDGFFGLTTYLQYASKEIAQCEAWATASARKYKLPHQFPWQRIDSSNVDAEGFVTQPFQFKLDHGKVLDLLTGHTLYNDSNVVIRELLQNAIDAVRLRQYLEKIKGVEYEPQINTRWYPDDRVLEIEDNGTGMSEEILERNFLRVGSSRYQDAQFIKEHPGFHSISRFGIGVLTAFMIADEVNVITRTPDGEVARHLKLVSVHGQYLMKLLNKLDPGLPVGLSAGGTLIRIKVRPSARLRDLETHLRRWIVVPRCQVSLQIDDGELLPIGFQSVRQALEHSLLAHANYEKSEGALIGDWGEKVEVREFEVHGMSVAYAVRWNEWFDQWEFLTADRLDPTSRFEPVSVGSCIEGILVNGAVPGFADRNGPIFALADATGANAPQTNVARSAIERSVKYDEYLMRVYQGYASHLQSELNEMQSARRASLTKASREIAYVAAVFRRDDGRRRPGQTSLESPKLLAKVMQDVSAFVLEENGERHAVSLADLGQYEQLMTIDSVLARHMEYVLGAIPTTASLAKILSAVESPLVLEDVPLLCSGLAPGFLTDLFLEQWGPRVIKMNSEQRLVELRWRRLADGQIATVSSADRIFSNFNNRAPNPYLYGYRQRESVFHVFIDLDNIDVAGLDGYEFITVAGRQYVLPTSPLMNIRSRDRETDPELMAWFLSWLAGQAVTAEQREDDPLFVDRMLQRIDASHDFDFLDMGTVREALERSEWTWFNVSRWERGPE